jgi:hypothetical protein
MGDKMRDKQIIGTAADLGLEMTELLILDSVVMLNDNLLLADI